MKIPGQKIKGHKICQPYLDFYTVATCRGWPWLSLGWTCMHPLPCWSLPQLSILVMVPHCPWSLIINLELLSFFPWRISSIVHPCPKNGNTEYMKYSPCWPDVMRKTGEHIFLCMYDYYFTFEACFTHLYYLFNLPTCLNL